MNAIGNLDDWALPALPHSSLFGAFLACHATGSALALLHAGVGCKGKTQRQLVDHDLFRESHHKVGWTELAEEQFIRDPDRALLLAARELCRRRRPRVLVLTTSRAVSFASSDLSSLAQQLERELQLPVVSISRPANADDLWAGYSQVVAGILRRVDWSQAANRKQVGICGYFFHRYEQDRAADLAELARLTRALGGLPGQVFLSGQDYSQLLQAHACGILCRLPHCGLSAEALAETSGRRVLQLRPPLGIRASGDWLRALGSALGAPERKTDRVVAAETERAGEYLAVARRRLRGLRLAVVADAPTAAGLVELAEELGLVVTMVAVLSCSVGRLSDYGTTVPDDCVVMDTPSLLRLRKAPESVAFDLAIRPDLPLAESAWQDIPHLELGFPSYRRHCIYPQAELGFNGAVALAQRLLDASQRVH